MTSTSLSNGASVGHPAPERGHVALPALWFGIFGAPAAWSVQTLVNLSVASHACYPRLFPLTAPITSARGIVFAVSLFALVTCLAALAVATRSWRRTRGEHHAATGRAREHDRGTAALETGEGRTRFMALSGVLTSLLFLVASLVHTASVFLVRPC